MGKGFPYPSVAAVSPTSTPCSMRLTWLALGKVLRELRRKVLGLPGMIWDVIIEGSLEVKLPTIWTDEKQSREEAERRERLEEIRVEEKE